MNDLLSFDIYAMIQPKTRQDIEAIFEEALAELRVINHALDLVLTAEPKVTQAA